MNERNLFIALLAFLVISLLANVAYGLPYYYYSEVGYGQAYYPTYPATTTVCVTYPCPYSGHAVYTQYPSYGYSTTYYNYEPAYYGYYEPVRTYVTVPYYYDPGYYSSSGWSVNVSGYWYKRW